MKFSALNIDFSSPSANHLGSRRPAHTGVKEEYSLKKWLQIDTDILSIITSTSDELSNGVNIDDIE